VRGVGRKDGAFSAWLLRGFCGHRTLVPRYCRSGIRGRVRWVFREHSARNNQTLKVWTRRGRGGLEQPIQGQDPAGGQRVDCCFWGIQMATDRAGRVEVQGGEGQKRTRMAGGGVANTWREAPGSVIGFRVTFLKTISQFLLFLVCFSCFLSCGCWGGGDGWVGPQL